MALPKCQTGIRIILSCFRRQPAVLYSDLPHFLKHIPKTMEVAGDQLKLVETELKRRLPQSQMVYGTLLLLNRGNSDPVKVFVDKWPRFSVIICKPHCEQKSDLFKDLLLFATDDVNLKETMRKSPIIDWTRFLCIGSGLPHMEIIKEVASEKHVPSHKLSVCHMMTLENLSKLPNMESSGITVSCLDESHVDLVNQSWKFGKNEGAQRMIHNMIAHFPSCCVLDADGKPVSWILTYPSCAIGMLYTQPEHRGKGYAKVLVRSIAKKLDALGYPVYCFIEEENMVSYSLFKILGFTEDPSYRVSWFGFNEF